LTVAGYFNIYDRKTDKMNSWLSYITPLLSCLELTILAILVVLGVTILWIFIWRMRVLAKAQGNPEKWNRILMEGFGKDLGVPESFKEENTPVRLMKTALSNIDKIPEALEKILEAQEMSEKRELEKGAALLGTVGANAPFLGLTGTVIGILSAFQRFAESSGQGSTEVMSAISRALVATALGLLVAIPAVIFYNIIRGKIRSILDQSRELRALLIARSLHSSVRKDA
jgi:biopolymer transport protein ExbB/TolQ